MFVTTVNQQHALFPVSLSANWQDAALVCSAHNISAVLKDWLLDPMSLTKRLKQHCNEFRVELLGQQIEKCSSVEANNHIREGDEVLVREVLLYCDGQPHVFARSLLPLSSLTGEEKQLATLGCQSLGQILFNDPNLIRKGIELSVFQRSTKEGVIKDVKSNLHSLVQYLDLPVTFSMFGRRSVFLLNNKPLMVAEVFLPHAHAYQKST